MRHLGLGIVLSTLAFAGCASDRSGQRVEGAATTTSLSSASTETTAEQRLVESTTTTEQPPTTAVVTTARAARSAFPPHTIRDLGRLGSVITERFKVIERREVGLPSCPQLSVRAIIPPGQDEEVTARLARVYIDEKVDVRCGGVVFGYRAESEVGGGLYTTGRLNIDGPDGSSPGVVTINVGSLEDGTSHVVAKFDYRS